MDMSDPKAFAAKVSANLARLLHEATDSFYSAKQPIEFILGNEARISYAGRFIRSKGGDGEALVAVTPAVRQELLAAISARQKNAEARAMMCARMKNLPIRADGLIALDLFATTVIEDATNQSMIQAAKRMRHFQRQDEARRAEQTRKQSAIEEHQPTADVDAWIIANMGFTAETLAALGKATRRDRRREARQRMSEKDC